MDSDPAMDGSTMLLRLGVTTTLLFSWRACVRERRCYGGGGYSRSRLEAARFGGAPARNCKFFVLRWGRRFQRES
jgi:hypothetical protein